jgi:predicted Rossmann-fold nucleotide-binding protein
LADCFKMVKSMHGSLERFRLTAEGTCLETLSPSEIRRVFMESSDKVHPLMERCALAVLNSGSERDDVKTVLEQSRYLVLEVIQTAGGIELELYHPPASAFVAYESDENGHITLNYKIIEGIKQHIFAVLRDLVFIKSEIEGTAKFDLTSSKGITDAIFLILRNAGIFEKTGHHKIIVCWGGHAIAKEEYDYAAEVGHQCGLRMMDIITGCGPGAMRGPMDGATIGHAKQRIKNGRYIGISEPGIIASEPPNPIVDPLVIMPDIEKRLEAFVRLGHGIIVFPGGAGTMEELTYILGILSHPDNKDTPFPLILTGPPSRKGYFEKLQRFLRNTMGDGVANRYAVVLGDPEKVAREINKGLLAVKAYREETRDSYYFNRNLHIPFIFQAPFVPTHENVQKLEMKSHSDANVLAATLRRFFSAIVSANVKPEAIKAVEERGPFAIRGEQAIMREIDDLLAVFTAERRMRRIGEYKPCYKAVCEV